MKPHTYWTSAAAHEMQERIRTLARIEEASLRGRLLKLRLAGLYGSEHERKERLRAVLGPWEDFGCIAFDVDGLNAELTWVTLSAECYEVPATL